MADKKEALTEQQLDSIAEKAEEIIVRRYKKKLLGASAGIAVAVGIIGYFGFDHIQNGATDKLVEKLLNEDFKRQIIRSVSDSLSQPSTQILTAILANKAKVDSIVTDLEDQHRDVLDAATREFDRTIEVLRQVRERSKKRR